MIPVNSGSVLSIFSVYTLYNTRINLLYEVRIQTKLVSAFFYYKGYI